MKKRTSTLMRRCNMQRFFDVLLSGLAITIISPLLLFIMFILRLTGEGEVFYRQIRIGKNGKELQIFKFATMLKDSANIGHGTVTIKNDPRVLPFGKVLRKTKINEVPQLINVFLGSMSLIGPRPQTHRCFNAFDVKSQIYIKSVLPGLSGIGSIVFRNEDDMLADAHNSLSFYDNEIAPYKGALEQWYVNNNSLKLYFVLIFLTLWCVVTSQTKLIWFLLPELPRPPEALEKYII